MNKRMKETHKEVQAVMKDIINKREKAMRAGEARTKDDLLGILLESSFKEVQEHGNNKNVGMSIGDVIEDASCFTSPGKRPRGFCLFGLWSY